MLKRDSRDPSLVLVSYTRRFVKFTVSRKSRGRLWTPVRYNNHIKSPEIRIYRVNTALRWQKLATKIFHIDIFYDPDRYERSKMIIYRFLCSESRPSNRNVSSEILPHKYELLLNWIDVVAVDAVLISDKVDVI